jgi:hypothetical protein
VDEYHYGLQQHYALKHPYFDGEPAVANDTWIRKIGGADNAHAARSRAPADVSTWTRL